jgi:hypothetical protein
MRLSEGRRVSLVSRLSLQPRYYCAQFEAFVGASLGNEIQDVRAVSGIDDPPLSVVEAA